MIIQSLDCATIHATINTLAAYVLACVTYSNIAYIEVVGAGVAAFSRAVHPLTAGNALPLWCPHASHVKRTSQLELNNVAVLC